MLRTGCYKDVQEQIRIFIIAFFFFLISKDFRQRVHGSYGVVCVTVCQGRVRLNTANSRSHRGYWMSSVGVW